MNGLMILWDTLLTIWTDFAAPSAAWNLLGASTFENDSPSLEFERDSLHYYSLKWEYFLVAINSL
jgi:hypothetical protein